MKKILSIFILVFLIASLLVGCTEPIPDDKKKEPAASDEKSSETNLDPEPEPEPDLKVGTAVGDLFADVTLETLDGGTVSTADYRGKIVVINIWATRCPPCKEELPDFNKVASEYEGEVVIIAAHEDYTRSSAPSYVETNFQGSKIIFAYDTPYGDAYYAAGGNGYIPQTAIIDKNGVILYSDSGILSYDTLVSIIEAAK